MECSGIGASSSSSRPWTWYCDISSLWGWRAREAGFLNLILQRCLVILGGADSCQKQTTEKDKLFLVVHSFIQAFIFSSNICWFAESLLGYRRCSNPRDKVISTHSSEETIVELVNKQMCNIISSWEKVMKKNKGGKDVREWLFRLGAVSARAALKGQHEQIFE